MRYKKHFFIAILFLFQVGFSNGQTLDARWLHAINSHSTPFLNRGTTFLTSTTADVAVGLPVILLGIGYLGNNESLTEGGWYMGSSLVISSFFTLATKYAVNRPRPYVSYPGYFQPRGLEGSPSFPSGHTSLAFSTAMSLSMYCPKWYVVVPSFVWATSVGYSRMNEGVHYPSDVLTGAIFGAGSAWLTFKLNKWLNHPIQRVSHHTLKWIHSNNK
jgi:membrane-associated phospholipid phosphatase